MNTSIFLCMKICVCENAQYECVGMCTSLCLLLHVCVCMCFVGEYSLWCSWVLLCICLSTFLCVCVGVRLFICINLTIMLLFEKMKSKIKSADDWESKKENNMNLLTDQRWVKYFAAAAAATNRFSRKSWVSWKNQAAANYISHNIIFYC